MATPMLFGSEEAPLYGVLHPAAQTNTALLICNSLGYEYMRGHRAIKSLAEKCCKQGVACLRFDFSGTGHSHGSLDNVNLEGWRSDIRCAFNELLEMSGAEKIQVLGLRFGALLALDFVQHDKRASKVIIWDPPTSGSVVFEEMRSAETWLQGEKDPYLAGSVKRSSPTSSNGYLGYEFSRQLESEICKLELKDLLQTEVPVTAFLGGEEQPPAELINSNAVIKRVAAPNNWSEIDNFGSVLLPQEMITTIAHTVCSNA